MDFSETMGKYLRYVFVFWDKTAQPIRWSLTPTIALFHVSMREKCTAIYYVCPHSHGQHALVDSSLFGLKWAPTLTFPIRFLVQLQRIIKPIKYTLTFIYHFRGASSHVLIHCVLPMQKLRLKFDPDRRKINKKLSRHFLCTALRTNLKLVVLEIGWVKLH